MTHLVARATLNRCSSHATPPGTDLSRFFRPATLSVMVFEGNWTPGVGVQAAAGWTLTAALDPALAVPSEMTPTESHTYAQGRCGGR